MAARADSKFETITLSADSDMVSEIAKRRVGEYILTTFDMGVALKMSVADMDRLEECYTASAKQAAVAVHKAASNAVELAYLTGMAALCMLTTFEGQMGHIKLEMDIKNFEGGASDGK